MPFKNSHADLVSLRCCTGVLLCGRALCSLLRRPVPVRPGRLPTAVRSLSRLGKTNILLVLQRAQWLARGFLLLAHDIINYRPTVNLGWVTFLF